MADVLNDVHSQLNATTVARIERPQTLGDLRAVIRRAAAEDLHVFVAGDRHAMRGQQFLAGSLHIDMIALDRTAG